MVGRPLPDREAALRLLRERFLNRTDYVAVRTSKGTPRPVEANGSLDQLLLGHLGFIDEPQKVRYRTSNGGLAAMTGHFRLGTYSPGLDDTTRWLCIDFDGDGHAGALVDPIGTAQQALTAFEHAGLPAYMERSGGGKGWHLWCFFDPALPAGHARAIGHALAPKDALLSTGAVADPRSHRGIEVFPKQDGLHKKGKKGFGNLVWLPWWTGAPEGSNTFYRSEGEGALEPYVPTELVVASPESIARVLASVEQSTPPPPPRSARAANSHANGTNGTSDSAWADWRRRALASLPLESVYGGLLTGNPHAPGWLECRDPSSSTGDENPSASVADGTGDAERGSFHSFITSRTLSVFDFLVEHRGETDFKAARARITVLSGVPEPTPAPPPLPTDGSWDPPSPAGPPSAGHRNEPRRKHRIVIRTEEHEVVDDAIRALSKIDGVYSRGHVLVHVIMDASKLAGIIRPPHAPRILPLGTAGLRDRLTYAADWVVLRERQNEIEEVRAHPPAWVAPAVEARKIWPRLRTIEGVVESPVLKPDGTVLTDPGYDETTGLLYQPNANYPRIPSQPTQEDVKNALATLLDVVCDFPFKSDAHRAAWLAGVLTPLARFAFAGPSPLFLVDANVRGAGKSLLADVTGQIVSGRPMARTPQAADEAEEVKRITAIALEGDRLMLIDNIAKPLGSGALDTVLTGTVWSERILGKSEKVSLPLLTVWYGTGNNVTFRGDTARRCLHIRLDSDLEKPESREGFKHPELLPWVHRQRASFAAAALTILRGYCAAGRPNMGIKSWGSFEGWSSLIRAAIVWAGLPDPASTRAELDEVDSDSTAVADLLAGWEEIDPPNANGNRGSTIAQVLERLRADEGERRYHRLRSALGELCPHPPGQLPTARKVGYALRRFNGRVVDGRKLETRTAAGNNLWFVGPVRPDGKPREGGTLSLPFDGPTTNGEDDADHQ